MCVPL
jgi:hypothetical protein